TPGRVGELVRLRWLSRETGFPLDRALPAALVDRAADLAAAGVVLVICVALSGGAGFVPVALLSIVVAALVTRERLAREIVTRAWRVTGRWPRLFARARRAARTLRPFSAPSVITAALVLGALGWAAEGYALALLLDWLGADVSVPVAVAIFLFAMVTGASTGAPGGLGGAEVALLGLLTLQGVPPAIALPATVIIRLTTLWFALAIGVLIFPYATWVSDRARTQP
ncbi:MAG: lysylphosphatidylglycerol synthase transmembrane domain-containing protein, partial [Pseudomonadota bacterium]